MTSADATMRALVELVHHMRPSWDRAGIYAAVHGANATRDIATVAHVAIDAARDPSASTPAVIATRDRASWQQPTLTAGAPQPPPLRGGNMCPIHHGYARNCPGCRADAIAERDEMDEMRDGRAP